MLPIGMGDVNYNDRPDMAVALVWGNDFTAGELHIFELPVSLLLNV